MMVRRVGENVSLVLGTFLLALLAAIALAVAAAPTAMAVYIASLNGWSGLAVSLLVLVAALNGFLALSAYKVNREMIEGREEESNPLWFFVGTALVCAALAPLLFS